MARFVAQAWRSWNSARNVAFLVVLALTAGVGSITTIYTVVDALVLRPVPYAHGERFVAVIGGSRSDANSMSGLNLDDVQQYEQQVRSFDVFGCLKAGDFNLTSPGTPIHVIGVAVEPSLAGNLGVNPERGRWFRDAKASSVVLSHNLWVRIGSDPALTGKSAILNGRLYTVLGIMPAGFNLPLAGPYGEAQVDLWVPLDAFAKGANRAEGTCFCYARLRQGVTLGDARSEVVRIAAGIAKQSPATRSDYTARVDDLRELTNQQIRPVLRLLFVAASVLLLITCANVAGLLVARSLARVRETAVRVALGARLPQLALQYLFEGWFVALPGALAGVALSAALIRILIAFAGESSARVAAIAVDGRAFAFAVLIALAAGTLTSIAPLWQAVRTMPNDVLGEGVRSSAGVRSRRLSQTLVVSEIALAFVLLALSAVLVAELHRLTRVSPGFDPDHLITFQVTVAPEGLPGKVNHAAYQEKLVRAVQAIPGVIDAGFTNQLPLDGCCYSTAIFPEGAPPDAHTGQTISFLTVHPGYFRAARIPLRGGRYLNDRDNAENPPLPVVINQVAAGRYWPDTNPAGRLGHFGSPTGDLFQVVGIVGDVKNNGLDNATVAEIYLPAAAAPPSPLKFVARSPLPPPALSAAIRRAVLGVNASQPIDSVRMMSDIVSESMALKRAVSYVMLFFAGAALLMAAIGAYGVVSYSVGQRTVEFGTRMALGAAARDLLTLVVGSGMKTAAYGIAIGGAVSVAATWFVVRHFEIASGNGGAGRMDNPGVLPFVASTVVVTAVAVVSSWFPAWSATLVSPMAAIRNELGREPGLEWFRRWFAGFRGSASAGPAELGSEQTLIAEWVDASRRAASFREALDAALGSLCASLGSSSGLLLESVSPSDYRVAAAFPRDAEAGGPIPNRGLLMSRLRSYGAPLPVSAADLDAWDDWAAQHKPEYIPEIAVLRAAEIRLAAPLRTNKEILGVLLMGRRGKSDRYTQAEKHLLRGCADQFALMLENARLTDRMVEQEKLRRDVALAVEVQRRLLAQQALETPAASMAAHNLPARSVGGDYYDFLNLDGDRIGIALADVAGKGVPAALIMSVVQATLRVISSEPDTSLPQLATRMNHFLFRSTGSNSYATFFYAQFDARSRELRYVNAGHNPPFLFRVSGAGVEVQELPAGGTVIGLFPKAEYEEGLIALRPGDLLAVFTDGVTEALSPAEEEFGEERLKHLLRNVVHLAVDEISARIASELKSWIGDAAQYDDLTFVLLKVK
jgi:predicted permease